LNKLELTETFFLELATGQVNGVELFDLVTGAGFPEGHVDHRRLDVGVVGKPAPPMPIA